MIGLGDMPARLMPRSAREVTTVGLRALVGSVPAESARTPGGWWALSKAAATMLRPALWVQTSSTRRSDVGAVHGQVWWLAAWAGWRPWVWRVQAWAAIWTASHGVPIIVVADVYAPHDAT